MRPHRIKHAVLVALFLFGCGALSFLYMNGSESRDKHPANAGLGTFRMSRMITESPVFSVLPRWLLEQRAVSISRERNASVLNNVLEVFDPSLRSFLTSVPIILDSSASTAKAYPAKGYIAVSPDWDNTVLQSDYRAIYKQRGMKPEDPVFRYGFKTELLIHEFLHILQVHQGIDRRSSYETIARWYVNPAYGVPSPVTVADAERSKDGRTNTLEANRLKYIVWHNLYNYQRSGAVPQDGSWKEMQYVQRYRSAEPGVEEFAYVGAEILAGGYHSENYGETGRWSENDWNSKKLRLAEASPEIIALFRGVFNPVLMQ